MITVPAQNARVKITVDSRRGNTATVLRPATQGGTRGVILAVDGVDGEFFYTPDELTKA